MGENDEENGQKYSQMSKNDIKYSQMSKNEEENTQRPAYPTLTIMNVHRLLLQNQTIKYEQMEDNLGIDRNTIQRAISWLKENGYINKEHSKVKGVWQLIK